MSDDTRPSSDPVPRAGVPGARPTPIDVPIDVPIDGPIEGPIEEPVDAATTSGTSKLVAARLRYLERQARLAPESFDRGFESGLAQGSDGAARAGAARVPRGSGPPNRHGMPKLPVGQREVRNWPVLDLGDQPEVARTQWRLVVGGLVHAPRTFTFEDLQALPRTELTVDFHCVTTWSRMDLSLAGVRLADLLAEVVPEDGARFVLFTGYDRLPGTDIPYTTSLPLARAIDPDVLVVTEALGEPLTREHGGPVRVVVPRLYAWKGTKWLRRIELLAEDRLGFWETRGYSNGAEPWFNDRYSSEARGAQPPSSSAPSPSSSAPSPSSPESGGGT